MKAEKSCSSMDEPSVAKLFESTARRAGMKADKSSAAEKSSAGAAGANKSFANASGANKPSTGAAAAEKSAAGASAANKSAAAEASSASTEESLVAEVRKFVEQARRGDATVLPRLKAI